VKSCKSTVPAPVQKTTLIPSGFSAAQLESRVGTLDAFVTDREYLKPHASTICPTASVTISGFSRSRPTRIPFARPTPAPTQRQTRIPSTSR
jgi:hypothetical protein